MPDTPDDPNVTRSQPQADATRDRSPQSETGTHPPDPDGTASGTSPTVAAFAGRLRGLADADAATDAIPGYEILGELGRGGMGVVYKARQLGLNREVALKTVLRADLPRASAARFWVEAEVMAAVKHPHVVQVFELGDHAGRPFLAMELAPGGSLADRLKAGPFPPLAAAELLEKIARGVAAAHELGIVHRDLKPANVLLASGGREPPDVPGSGGSRPPLALEPKVTDFGLAKWRSTDLTQSQALMGTPAYMAPEQAAGRAKFVGPAADVWALGVILYECVAGKRPFTGDTQEALLSQIQSAEPTALRTHVRGVPRDLDTVVAKCLTKEPEHRYPTAAELADDLGRLLRGEPIAARPVGRIERLARWVRRKPTAAAAYGLSALAVALALVTFVIAGFWREAEGAKTQAESARDEADRLRGIADEALLGEAAARREVEREREKLARFEYGRTIQVAHQAWRDNKLAEARALLDRTRPEYRGWEWRYVHRLCHSDLLTLEAHRGGVYGGVVSASFSQDGSRILTGSDGSGDYTARIWDSASGELLLTIPAHKQALFSVSFSPDGARVVTGGDGPAKIWNAKTGTLIVTLAGHTGAVMSASFSRDGRRIVSGGGEGTAKVWDAENGVELRTFKSHAFAVNSASFSPDGSRIITGSSDGTAKVWDAKTGDELFPCRGHREAIINSASFSHDGLRIVTASSDKTAKVWDAKTGTELLTLKGHTDTVWAAAFSPDSARIVTASFDRTAKVWDAKTGDELLHIHAHADILRAAAFSPDGSRIVTGSYDKTAKVWDSKLNTEAHTLHEAGKGAGLIFSPVWFNAEGTRVLAWNGFTVMAWDATTGDRPTQVGWDFSKGSFVGWTVPGNAEATRTVTADNDFTARVWDKMTGSQLLTLRGHTGLIRYASFSPDGNLLVTGSADKTAKLWDARTGKEVHTLAAHACEVHAVSFSPDGSRVVTTSVEGVAIMWDVRTGRQVHTLLGHTQGIGSTSFSSDGSRVITASWDGTARVWDVKTGTELLVLRGHVAVHSGGVRSASFDPSGERIVTTGGDQTVRVWDARSGAELLTLKGNTGDVHFASWSPDGTRLVTAGHDGMVKVWDSRPVNRAFLPK